MKAGRMAMLRSRKVRVNQELLAIPLAVEEADRLSELLSNGVYCFAGSAQHGCHDHPPPTFWLFLSSCVRASSQIACL